MKGASSNKVIIPNNNSFISQQLFHSDSQYQVPRSLFCYMDYDFCLILLYYVFSVNSNNIILLINMYFIIISYNILQCISTYSSERFSNIIKTLTEQLVSSSFGYIYLIYFLLLNNNMCPITHFKNFCYKHSICFQMNVIYGVSVWDCYLPFLCMEYLCME